MMSTVENKNYQRVASAIRYIQENFKKQPGLDEIAKEVNLSPFHFQRLFKDWAGVSPKRFLQFISAQHAMQVLNDGQSSLMDASYEVGLSGTSRLHDLIIKIEGMTPGEYKNGGENLNINYHYFESLFGEILVASTEKGLCYLGFVDENLSHGRAILFEELKQRYPNAQFFEKAHVIQTSALQFFTQDWSQLSQIRLHLKGTDFQIKVWEALLKIPAGKLSSYGDIASHIQRPSASRAVGTAIGNNPVGFLIPCHRVIRATGEMGGYMWGVERKSAMIGWEAAQVMSNETI